METKGSPRPIDASPLRVVFKYIFIFTLERRVITGDTVVGSKLRLSHPSGPSPSITPSCCCVAAYKQIRSTLILLLVTQPNLPSQSTLISDYSRIMDGGTPNFKTWNILYPVYINSKKTVAEGRRISATKACENPTALEMGDCCGHLKIPFAIEIDKAYPRDFMQVGRVRVLLKRADGSLHNPLIASKKQLMIRIAELVPRHPGRLKKQEAATSSSNAAGPAKSGKGGKKKR
ncbi:hypothetical protein R6Q57_007259 [Mikania cordata]